MPGEKKSTPLQGCRDACQAAETSFNAFVEAMQPNLKKLWEQIEKGEQLMRGMKAKINEKDHRISELEALLKSSEEKYGEKVRECENLKADILERETKLDELESKLEDLKKSFDELQEKNNLDQQRLADLRSSLQKATQTIEQQKGTINGLNEKIVELTKVKEYHETVITQLDTLCHKLDPTYAPNKDTDRVKSLAAIIKEFREELIDTHRLYNSYSTKMAQIKKNNEMKLKELVGSANSAEKKAAEKEQNVGPTEETLRTLPIRALIKETVTIKKAFANSLTNMLFETKTLEEANIELTEYKRINELLKQINKEKMEGMISEFKKSEEEKDKLSESEVKKMAKKKTSMIKNAIDLDANIDTIIGIFEELARANTRHILLIKRLEDKLREHGHGEDVVEQPDLTDEDCLSMRCSYVTSPTMRLMPKDGEKK